MALRAVALLVLSGMALTGCISATDEAEAPTDAPLVGELLKPATTPLWVNPQTTPHPAFNFPTLSHPATGAAVPAWWMPIDAAALPASIAAMEPVSQADIPSGAGMSVFGRLAVVPGFFEDTHILDITDPAAPVVLSAIPEERHRNVDFIAYPTGRLVAVFSTSNGVLPYWDITDPAKPVKIGELEPTAGTHKVNVVPGTPIVYNANSNGGAALTGFTEETGEGITEIFDLSDAENPVHVQDFANGFGCHHIYFWNNPAEERYRALCAGIEFTQIWDIADPRNPVVIVSVPVHHGVAGTPSAGVTLFAFSHFSVLNYAGDVLIVGDEMGGGSVPPGCVAHVSTPIRDVSTPLGALWFYDVSDETNPQVLGWFSPGQHFTKHQAAGSCTAHHGRLVPDPEGRDLLAMAFYGAGTVLVDFSDPTSPRLVDQFNESTDTWEVQYYNGYLFTGDLARGMDVFKFV